MNGLVSTSSVIIHKTGVSDKYTYTQMSSNGNRLWSAIKADLKILSYQQDCLAGALQKCHHHALLMTDPRDHVDHAEQFYCDSLSTAMDIFEVKMERTAVALRKNLGVLLDKCGGDEHLKIHITTIIDDIDTIMTVSRQAVSFWRCPRNAVCQHASRALLSIIGHFKVDTDSVLRCEFATAIRVP